MKKYIIFGNVFGIGGWQIYIEGRINHLLKQGFKVFAISPCLKGNQIKLESCFLIPILSDNVFFRPMSTYSKRQRDDCVRKVNNFLDVQETDEVYIEATSVNSSIWGEYYSSLIGGKCFSYLLHSHLPPITREVRSFFMFKHGQRLLAGMTPNTLKELLFQGEDVDNNLLYWFKADGRDPLTEKTVDTSYIEKFKSDGGFVLGYFGNLDKPHVVKVSLRISDYARKHNKDRFMFLTIGSSTKKSVEERIKKTISVTSNMVYYNVPECYPVPSIYFQLMDVCIGSWGSARTAARTLVPTIRLMDDVNVSAQGIIGITLKNGIYFDLPCGKKVFEDYLDDLIYLNTYDLSDNNAETEYKNFEVIQSKLDFFLKTSFYSKSKVSYFNVNSIKPSSLRETIMRFVNIIFGVSFIDFVKGIKRKGI